MAQFLTNDDAFEIKKRLWNGERQLTIARDYFVSDGMISHIQTGRKFFGIPWPDGSVGELSQRRKIEIKRDKALSNNQTPPEFIQQKVIQQQIKEQLPETLARLGKAGELQPDDQDNTNERIEKEVMVRTARKPAIESTDEQLQEQLEQMETRADAKRKEREGLAAANAKKEREARKSK